MSTWINKKFLSLSEKVIENVIDSFTNKNTHLENIQNIQETQLGKIISKVISSKYFFKNDDIYYNAKELEFKWEVNKKWKKRGIKKKKKKKKIQNEVEKQDLKKFNNIYSYMYDNNENELNRTDLNIDEMHYSNPLNLNKEYHIEDSNRCEENEKGFNSQLEHNNTYNQNISNDIKNKTFHETPNFESNHFPKINNWKNGGENDGENGGENDGENDSNKSKSSTCINFLECLSINKYKLYNNNSYNLGSSSYISSKNDENMLSSELSKIYNQSSNSNIFNNQEKKYTILKQRNLCKMNLFIKEAKLLFYNKTTNINNISIYCTTIIEKKKYIGQQRRLSFKTLPINNLIINEYINHGVKDIYSDIIINIKYKNNVKNKNKKNVKDDITIGRIIIPLFLLLNTYRCKIKKIKNKMRYCTKCFLWLHIFPCNNKLFNYKFFKPVEGFEGYGMINPLSTLGFLNLKIKIVFKKNPLLLTLYSNIRKPLFYYKLPKQFEPLYCQYYTENFFVYIKNLPTWIYKFFYIFNPYCIEPIQLNYYDYIFVLFFWLFFFRLIVFSPFFHFFIHIFFCLFFISLSYKYGSTQNRENDYSRYDFKPLNIKGDNKRNSKFYGYIQKINGKRNLPHSQEAKDIQFYDKKVGGVLESMHDIDFDYCKCPDISKNNDKSNIPCINTITSLSVFPDNINGKEFEGNVNEHIVDNDLEKKYIISNEIKKKKKISNIENNSSPTISNLSSFSKSTISLPKSGIIKLEENCFKKNNHNFESDIKYDKLEVEYREEVGDIKINNKSVEKNKKEHNVTNFAKKIQNMMIDGTKTNTINMNNWNTNVNKFINLFTKKGDGQNGDGQADDFQTDDDSDNRDKSSEKYKDNILIFNKNKDNSVGDKKDVYLLYDSGSNTINKCPNKISINSSKNSKNDEHDSYQVENDSEVDNTSESGGADYFGNSEKNENNIEKYQNNIEKNQNNSEKNENNIEKYKKIENHFSENCGKSKIKNNLQNCKNYATPLFDTADNPFMSSNNLLESRFLKKNALLDAFKNSNDNSIGNYNKNESNLIKKKSQIKQSVKSPFHNFYLSIKSINDKDVSIFSNHIGVPNIQLLLSRFIILITCAQTFTGIFTMIYEKINYALNWNFNFYTINNIIILFILCYSISFILYILSFIPLSIYRFIFFIIISILIVKSYEFTEDGQRARLYFKNKKIKNKYLNVFKKKIAKTIIHILKGKKKYYAEWILYFYKIIYNFIFNLIIYTKFIIFFLKNWITRLLILKDIEHIKIARLQGFKNLYFFIHNRMIDRQNFLITENSNNIKNFGNIQLSNNSNQLKPFENYKKNIEDENVPKDNNILSAIVGNKKNNNNNDSNNDSNKNILRNPLYENYKNIDLCIYSSSENDNNSISSQYINEHNKNNNNLEKFKDEMDMEYDDNISISQMTDNGNMNINVDIFLHYYFKKKKQDIFNNFININRNYTNIYKDINILNNGEEHKINNLYYADYINDEHNYSSSYDNNKRTKRF
ncbi:hypothetical protein YYC_04376 [Plasmodium yoelii 17X]|uniref:Uncharacterized protein n=1 Tax=Plasmodium yoelii 17X TaxID=1323249 RepID=V7PFE2_PLAYE|nr:hypothetical protein YYC_04376 [Plasmodium yoelii 17X]